MKILLNSDPNMFPQTNPGDPGMLAPKGLL